MDEPLPRGAMLTRIRASDRFSSPSKPILQITNLTVKRGSRTVIGLNEHGEPAGFNLDIYPGEIAILQAPNGWGKSTLLDAFAGIIPVAGGTVRLGETALSSLPDWQRPKHGLHLNTASAPYFDRLRLSDIATLSGHQWDPDSLLPANRVLSSLSGGQLRRASLTSFLQRDNLRVALLDEPFLGLDEAAIREFAARVRHCGAEAVVIAEPCLA